MSSNYVLKFELMGLPKGLNGNKGGWKRKWRETREWKDRVHWAAFTRRAIPERPFKKARVTLTRISSVEPDFDNLSASFKPILDGLVEAKVLENDKGSNFVGGRPEYRWEPGAPGEGRIRVEVEA